MQIVLSLGLICLAIYSLYQRSRSPLIAWSMFGVCLLGEALVLDPDLATAAAHVAGVGRGTDLVLYCFILASLGAILNLYLRLRRMHEEMTVIVRELALLRAVSRSGGASAGNAP